MENLFYSASMMRVAVPQNISKTYFKNFFSKEKSGKVGLGLFAVLQLKIGVAALVIRP